MQLRLAILVILWTGVQHAMAQQDSIVLQEVTVHGTAERYFLAGSSIRSLDTTLRSATTGRHLGDVLAFQFPIYFRNYGNGMLSTVSMRGTSAQHTAVLWNGVNIASFSLGQTDFAMVSTSAFDSVNVHTGGGSARFGSGAFGGTILLNATAPTHSSLLITQEAGSFGRYGSTVAGTRVTPRLSLSATGYYSRITNDFPIFGTTDRQTNAAYQLGGITNSFRVRLTDRSVLTTDGWYHAAHRQLQSILNSANAHDTQRDENIRILVGSQHTIRGGVLRFTGGLTDDDIVYNGARSHVRRWLITAHQRMSTKPAWQVEWSANANHIIGNIREYPTGQVRENRAEVALAASRIFRKATMAVNLRQPFVSHVQAPLLVFAGMDIVVAERGANSLLARINASRNFRAPTLNERYWENAGDKYILPERSHAAETGLVYRNSTWQLEATGFYQRVDDWIQWKPAEESGRFIPQNIVQVRVTGFETAVSMHQKIARGLVRMRGSVQPLRSIVTRASPDEPETVGKQLVYTPTLTASALAVVHYQDWSATLAAQGAGVRFTDSRNNDRYALAPYGLLDVTFGRTLRSNWGTMHVMIAVRNATNSNYQLYMARAQPGRNFLIQLNYQRKSKTSKS